MSPINNLNYLVHHLAAVLGKQSDQVLKEQLGIGYAQYRILMVLDWNPRVQQSVIANHLGQTDASISRQVKVLKEKGLLGSKIDPQNKRKHISVPTPRGMQITEAATDLLRRSFNQDFAPIGEDQLSKLTQSLQVLHKQVCRPGKLGACDHQLDL
jgi:DNA-binding MarR family transcriptional regulator